VLAVAVLAVAVLVLAVLVLAVAAELAGARWSRPAGSRSSRRQGVAGSYLRCWAVRLPVRLLDHMLPSLRA
jgi:hypothetical protein